MTLPFQSHLPAPTTDSIHPLGKSQRRPLDSREVALIVITALHLCFLPWALGSMPAWSQLTSLGFALAGFVLAGWPRTVRENSDSAPPTRRWPAARLLRLPVFWFGVAFLGYIAIQGLNPAWQFQSDADSWWLEPLDPVAWLPSSVAAPFDRSNAWRMLTVFGSLLLLVCSVWIGFTRRKSYHTLLTLLAVNSGVLALFALAQRLSDTPLIFWHYASSNAKFVASFIYPNHAGPYFYLLTAVALGLSWWEGQRARQRQENPGPAVGFAFVAICCCLPVIFSFSRTSVVLLLILMVFTGGHLVVRLLQRTGAARYRPELLPLTLILAAVFCVVLATLSMNRVRDRFADLLANPTAAVLDRTLPRQAATDMFRDHWLYGWGAGCFRYGFPKYTKAYPAIHYFPHGPRRYWEHAHNDILEFPVELGVVGTTPLVLVLGCTAWRFYRQKVWRNVLALSLVVGCALIMLHAWVDFVFQNPAILLTWAVLLAGALRWSELDRPSEKIATGLA